MRTISILILIFYNIQLSAQNARTTDGKVFIVNTNCAYIELHGITSSEMQTLIDEQKNKISSNTEEIKSIPCRELPNKCAAFVDENGERYILYDPEFIDKNGGINSWAVKGVIAHEIGHHKNKDDLSQTSILRTQELDADLYAGMSMQMIGASLSQALSFLEILDITHECRGEYTSRHNYPCKEDRIIAVTEGYNKQAKITGQYIDQSLAGPSAAFYSAVIPGLGNAFVQEKFRIVDYLLPAASLGSSVFGFIQYSNSKNTWEEYLNSQSPTDIEKLKTQSNDELSRGKVFLTAGVIFLVADVFKVYKKGKKNSIQQKKFGLQISEHSLGLSLCYYID